MSPLQRGCREGSGVGHLPLPHKLRTNCCGWPEAQLLGATDGPMTSTAAAPSPVRGYEMSRGLDLRKRAAVLLVNPNCPHSLQALACCFH